MNGPMCPRCGKPVNGLRSSKHIVLVLGCSHWISRTEAAAVVAAEKARTAA